MGAYCGFPGADCLPVGDPGKMRQFHWQPSAPRFFFHFGILIIFWLLPDEYKPCILIIKFGHSVCSGIWPSGLFVERISILASFCPLWVTGLREWLSLLAWLGERAWEYNCSFWNFPLTILSTARFCMAASLSSLLLRFSSQDSVVKTSPSQNFSHDKLRVSFFGFAKSIVTPSIFQFLKYKLLAPPKSSVSLSLSLRIDAFLFPFVVTLV